MNLKNFLAAILLCALVFNAFLPVFAQANVDVFDKVELLVPSGDDIDEKSVRVRFLQDELQIEAVSGGKIYKNFKYSEIKDAEYSYSKSPRWKTGLGLGAASLLFLPLLFVAIPVGFTKHRRHWLTIKTDGDYAVLKLSKKNRKLILPAFESKTGIRVGGAGENK
jgi:hypothetical protein